MATIHVHLDEIDWTAVAAIATAVLAVMTWRLAVSTRALAKETKQDVEAAFRPVVTATYSEVEGKVGINPLDLPILALRPEVLNDGHGQALNCSYVAEVGALTDEGDGPPVYAMQRRTNERSIPPLRVGERFDVSYSGEPSAATGKMQRFIFRIRYEDIGGNPHTTLLAYDAEPLNSDVHEQSFIAGLSDTKIRVGE